MNKFSIVTCVIVLCMSGATAFAQVGINSSTPDASAMLDVKSSNKGFLPPRLTQSQIDALDALLGNGGPANGLVVYNTSEQCLQVNKGVPTNSDWECLKGPSSTTGGGGSSSGGITIVNGVCTLPQVAQDTQTTITDLPATASGQIWMDRNLGATLVGGIGDYYQFGRGKDGHEDVNSTVVYNTNIAASVIPGHGNFIVGNASNPPTTGAFANDAISASHSSWVDIGLVCDAALYQNGNDPCPDGYRIPTVQEWEAEFTSSMSDAQKENHWNNVLFLPDAGHRRGTNSGGIITAGETHMTASDIDIDQSIIGNLGTFLDGHFSLARRSATYINIEGNRANADGNQIRCIKE